MNLKPWEFERLQPGEFQQMYDGYIWRHEQQENMLAYFTCSLMNVSGRTLKRAITAKQLLKPLREKKTVKQDKKADEEYLKSVFNLEGGQADGNDSGVNS